MHNNLRIELKKFGWQQGKYSLAEEKKLGELDKNVTLCCCLFQPPCLIHFAVFFNLNLLRLSVYSRPKGSCLTKDQLYTRMYLQ